MKPTAALRHEDLLLVLFGWEFEGSMRYALNFRKVEDDDIQLAAEIVRPMRLDTLKVERIKADANAGDPTADDFQEALICGLIDAFDILEHFSICNVEAPTPIKNLISGAMALLEKEDISEASTASRVQVRVANRL